MSRKAVIFGATSLIAEHTARLLAAEGWELALVARHREALRAVAAHLRLTGSAPVHELQGDADDMDALPRLVDSTRQLLGRFDLALIAWGSFYPDPDARQIQEMERVNHTATMALAELLGEVLAQQRGGTLAVLSSVAGDVLRPANFFYGSTKAALNADLWQLRLKLASCGVHVLTLKPGRVETPMTAFAPRSFLTAMPAATAAGIRRALRGRRDVVYVPGWLRAAFFVLRLSPKWLVSRLRF